MTDLDVAAKLGGAFPPIPTPFADDQSLDLDGLGTLVDRLADAGIPGLTLLGSSSEATYMTEDERARVFEAASRRADGRMVLVAGVIRHGTRQAVEEAKRYRELGAQTLMVALPQYYETPFSQIVEHFRAIRTEVGLPTLYYHYPKPTHLSLDPDAVAKLFAEVDLCGIKNSSLDTSDTLAQIEKIDRPVRMFSGQSFDYLACLQGGAVGTICPVAVIKPKTVIELKRAFDQGDETAATEAQNRIYSAAPFVMPEPGEGGGMVGVPHAGIKAALTAVGIFRSDRVRDPQPQMSAGRREEIRAMAGSQLELG